MRNFSEDAHGHHIGDKVIHDDAALNRCESVLVKPETKGSKTLFVHKLPQWDDMFDFSDPGHRYGEECGNFVGNDEPGVNFIGYLRQNPKMEKPRREGLEVSGGGKKRPRLLERDGNKLASAEMMNFQGSTPVLVNDGWKTKNSCNWFHDEVTNRFS